FSIKEYSLDNFWEKKQREYEPFRAKYKGLYDPNNRRILGDMSGAIISRDTDIAEAILEGWEEAPDSNPIWRKQTPQVGSAATERIRRIPREIIEEGSAVTWPAIRGRIPSGFDTNAYRPVLQNVYFNAYLAEYHLRVITGLPYISHPFVTNRDGFAY